VISSLLAWHGFSFRLPPGWEVTAYRLNPKRGEFRIHQRLVDRAHLTWVQMAGRPDIEGLSREIVDRQLGTPGKETVAATVRRHGRWTISHVARGQPFQALAWIEHDKRLLHWDFPSWEGEGAGQPWQALLDSLIAEQGDDLRWALFGAEVLLPRRFKPIEVDAQPGAVRIEFGDSAGVQVIVRRLGMARRLLEERPLASWVRRHAFADRLRLEQVQDILRGADPAVRTAFTVIGERTLDRVIWRRWPGESLWWHEAGTNRIRAIEQCGPSGTPRVDLTHACP
jgi:hypothetical protein